MRDSDGEVVIKWAAIDEMKQLTIYPAFLKDKTDNISEHIEHFIDRES